MRSLLIKSGNLVALWLLVMSVSAQPDKGYDQHLAFDPSFLSVPNSPFRSASGAPAANYWQNTADYFIAVELDTLQNIISGTCEINYTNNSPDQLTYLWLQLDQNLFRKGSTGSYTQGVRNSGGYDIHSVEILRNGNTSEADYRINDTRMQIRLPEILDGNGGKISIRVAYKFKIAEKQVRQGILKTSKGSIYDVTYWYPRMCVYDDLHGWDALPYQASGEFYNEYGDFDYLITVPHDMIVAGSGELQNPQKVLTSEQINRLEKAKNSDESVFIITPDEAGTKQARPQKAGKITWHFRMKNTRDVAWSASKAFIWDAARINLPERKKALAMSFYPTESKGVNAWDRSTEYVKHSVEHFSKKWFPYPYPVAVNVGGPVGGMEFPGLVFCGAGINKANVLYFIAAHEIGHVWFPMIVGSNERRYAFMDEGLNTFIDVYAQDDFNKGEFGPKRDGEYDPKGENPARDLVPYLVSPEAESIMQFADVLQPGARHPLSYYKSALGLVILREFILDPDRFDYAFKTYIRRWAYKHPSPDDFFKTMNDASGEELNWFWNAWFYHTWTLDQAVTDVKYAVDDSHTALIKLENRRQMVMPVLVEVRKENGDTERIKLPVEIWQRGGSYTLKFKTDSPVVSVEVDPDKQLPDTDPENNTWTLSNINP